MPSQNQPGSISLTLPDLSHLSFRDDTRAGAATQIDFVNGMIILLGGVLFYFAVTSLFLSSLETPSPEDQATAIKASNKLVEDAFRQTPGDDMVTANCIDAYFTGTGGGACDHNPTWGDVTTNEYQYLQNSLSLKDTQNARIELRTASGNLYTNPSGTTYQLGGTVGTGNIGKYERRVTTDLNGDDTPEWYTLVIYVW